MRCGMSIPVRLEEGVSNNACDDWSREAGPGFATGRHKQQRPIGANSCPSVRHQPARTRTIHPTGMASTGDSTHTAAYGLACEACARMKCKCVQLPSSQDGRCER
jgi:hypothetical protein